jgi:hypothetical protein
LVDAGRDALVDVTAGSAPVHWSASFTTAPVAVSRRSMPPATGHPAAFFESGFVGQIVTLSPSTWVV